MIDLSALRPYAKNARRHSRAQIKQIVKSIETFGFTNPILVSDDLEILAGHGRAAAAQLIGMKQASIVRLSNLSPAERKAYVLADNKLALNAGGDREVLAGASGKSNLTLRWLRRVFFRRMLRSQSSRT